MKAAWDSQLKAGPELIQAVRKSDPPISRDGFRGEIIFLVP
jgi:hypothetical protein